MWDLIYKNARVIDGSGSEPFVADVAVEKGVIAEIGPKLSGQAEREIKTDGLVLSPGFIDLHTHSDFYLNAFPRAESRVHQGVTTEVVGNCGTSVGPVSKEHLQDFMHMVSSHGVGAQLPDPESGWPWPSVAAFSEELARNGLGLNIAPLVGHSSVRCAVMGFDSSQPDENELESMCRLVKLEMDQGLFGMSAGLIYHPGAFGQTGELTALARVAARAGGIFTLHMRSESHGIDEAIAEALQIARNSGVSLEISHLKCELPANWGKAEHILGMLDEARQNGMNVSFDQYPYTAFRCGLIEIFPVWAKENGSGPMIQALQDPDKRQRIIREMTQEPFDWENPMEGLGWDQILINGFQREAYQRFEGKSVQDIAQALQLEPLETVFRIFSDEQGRLSMIVFSMCEPDVERIMKHPYGIVASDGQSVSPEADFMVHPRSYGTFVRVLGRYVRQRQVIPLETAVAKMSGLPAQKLGLPDRGFIRQGYAADLVLFDPDRVSDRAEFGQPHQYPVGIHQVMVNGKPVIEEGEHTGALAGRLLKRV